MGGMQPTRSGRPDPRVQAQQAQMAAAMAGAVDLAAVKARSDAAARSGDNMIPAMLDACRAEATLGEICDALRAEWGTYTEPARF